jgi:hypothetical protein
VDIRILERLLSMPRPQKTFSEAQWERIIHLCVIGFFWLLRPGEFVYNSFAPAPNKGTRSRPFRLSELYFAKTSATGRTPVRSTALTVHDANLSHAGLGFADQKNGQKGERMFHSPSGQSVCPVHSLQTIALQILKGGGTASTRGNANTLVHQIYDREPLKKDPGWTHLTSAHIKVALRLAAADCESQTGIPAKEINSKSLRPGGATALLCSNVDKNITSLIGRWRSDAIDTYFRTGTVNFTEGFSKRMVANGRYIFHPYHQDPTATEHQLPNLLPDNAPPIIQDAYFQVLIDDASGSKPKKFPPPEPNF